MNVIKTELEGVLIFEPRVFEDDRGFFARAWCQDEFGEHGLVPQWVQANLAYSKRRGTLRGLHYQAAPYGEAKLMRCIRGAMYDVILDLRPESATFEQWGGVELTAENRRALYVPQGFAHGYLTLVDDTEVFYPVKERGKWFYQSLKTFLNYDKCLITPIKVFPVFDLEEGLEGFVDSKYGSDERQFTKSTFD